MKRRHRHQITSAFGMTAALAQQTTRQQSAASVARRSRGRHTPRAENGGQEACGFHRSSRSSGMFNGSTRDLSFPSDAWLHPHAAAAAALEARNLATLATVARYNRYCGRGLNGGELAQVKPPHPRRPARQPLGSHPCRVRPLSPLHRDSPVPSALPARSPSIPALCLSEPTNVLPPPPAYRISSSTAMLAIGSSAPLLRVACHGVCVPVLSSRISVPLRMSRNLPPFRHNDYYYPLLHLYL